MQRRSNQNAAQRILNNTPHPCIDWKTEDLASRCVRFIETQCKPNKGHTHGQYLKVAAWQHEWLDAVLNNATITSSILSLARGNGKTTFCGAVATWALYDPAVADTFGGQPVIPVIAPTIQQSVRGVYGAALAFVKANPELRDRAKVFTANGNWRLEVPANLDGSLFPLAANVEHLQGLDPMLSLADEVGFIPTEVWTALELASGKRPRNLVLGLGTKSPGETDNVLDHLTEAVRLQGTVDGFHLVIYEAQAGCELDDVAQWHKANPALVEGYLSEDELHKSLPPKTPEALYRTFRLNQKVAAVDGWLGIEGATYWDSGRVTDNRDFCHVCHMFIGVDKSRKGDCSAIAAIQRCDCLDPDNQAWYARTWIYNPVNGVIDHAGIRDQIIDLWDTYNVQVVGYDNRFFVEGADMLYDMGLNMVDVPQTNERMEPAYTRLYQLIVKGQLLHDDDKSYRSHVLSAVAKPTANGGFMLQKSKSKQKIDACVATAIAVYVSDQDGFDWTNYIFSI